MFGIDVDIYAKVIFPTVTFVLGFFTSRFTYSKKERYDIDTQKVKTSTDLTIEQEKAFQAFAAALSKYVSKTEVCTIDDFFSISTAGEAYFSRLKTTCDAIIAGRLDINSIRNTHKPAVAEAVNKSLPAFYEALQTIARKNNVTYTGCLQRSNYKSIYEVNDSNY